MTEPNLEQDPEALSDGDLEQVAGGVDADAATERPRGGYTIA